MSAKKRDYGVLGVVGAILIAGSSQIWIQKTDAYRLAVAHVLSMPEVKRLGEPIQARLKPFAFRWSSGGETGEAEFAIRARGSAGELIVDVDMRQDLGAWSVINASVRE